MRGMRALRSFKPDRWYHLISRIANRAFCLTDEERTRFVERLWRVAKFSGIEVPAYCLMSDHFHLLVHLPEAPELGDGELFDRIAAPAVVASMGCDELVPAENFHRLTNAYHRAGVEVSASLTPGCGHGDMPRGLEADVVRRINRMALRTGLLRKSEVECRSGRTMNARSCR